MLDIRNLVKSFEDRGSTKASRVYAVDDLSLHVAEGEFFTLLGPSGCGKSTTLRCLAGLEKPDSGEIEVDGRSLFSSTKKLLVPVSERGFGMVFQSYAIWPHMTVWKNAAFPLEAADRGERVSRAEKQTRVEEALEVMQLGHLANRQATDLSGGQQQRLALARALVRRPPLLLLDEPLSNLDASLRDDMRFELQRLQKELGVTTIYVTHDQVEALAMSNKIAVMRNGKIDQLGSPRDIYDRPATTFVAGFIGTTNFISGTVQDADPQGRYSIDTPVGLLVAESAADLRAGDRAHFTARPEHVTIREGVDDVGVGELTGVVKQKAFIGEAIDFIVTVGDQEIRTRTRPTTSIPMGAEVTVTFDEFATILPEERTSGGDAAPDVSADRAAATG